MGYKTGQPPHVLSLERDTLAGGLVRVRVGARVRVRMMVRVRMRVRVRVRTS